MLIDSVRERLRETRMRAEAPSSQARSTVHKWINAQAVPRIDALVRFSATHGISVIWLLTGRAGSADEAVDLENFRNRFSNSLCGREREICEQTGITLAALNSWIAPSRKTLPKIDGLLAIAQATDSSIRWLLTGQGPRTPFEGERDAPREAADHLSPTLPSGAVRVVPATGAQVRKLPFLGRIEAGFSALAIQEAELCEFSKWMCPRGDAFALRVHGDSMIDAGIRSGDIVIIRATPRAGDGEVVAATVGEESMLKRVRHDADGWWLVAANRTLTERRPLAGAIIHGVVHMVIRQFETTPFVVPDDDSVQ